MKKYTFACCVWPFLLIRLNLIGGEKLAVGKKMQYEEKEIITPRGFCINIIMKVKKD